MTNDTVNEPTVAVIGAHGKVARLAIPQLAEHGCTVAGVIRNPQHAADIDKMLAFMDEEDELEPSYSPVQPAPSSSTRMRARFSPVACRVTRIGPGWPGG